MSQVIIVSNRLPISVTKDGARLTFIPSLGGLATGLSSFVNDPGNTWIGWPGLPSDDLSESEKQFISKELLKRNCYPVFLTKKQIDEFYNGYSNSVLWPIFHDLPLQRKDKEKKKIWWNAYRKVNEQFADVVINLAKTKSQIWVHDYQLLLLPEILRREKSIANIGFFLHIPFPNAKSLAKLDEAKKVVIGMLGADLIGFHTHDYVHSFLDYCETAKLGEVTTNTIKVGEHISRIDNFPMGIDYDKFARASKSKLVKRAVRRNKKLYSRQKLVVSVDRLDPTKGLDNRLIAYREYLVRNPNRHGKVVFVMVAAPSRTDIAVYKNLAKKLTELSSEINKKFGDKNWKPVDYINISISFEEVTALFRVADVAFIAPLRDGMNLASKEFIASNNRRGVLILSETAGAAEELQDALIVNPSQSDSLVEALEQALSMNRRELRQRLKRMKKDISVNTVQVWAKTFVDTLQKPIPGTANRTLSLSGKTQANLIEDYKASDRRLLLLDYDGTLVPFSNDYREAKPPKSLLKLIEGLANNPNNEVVLISGRSAEDLQEWFGDLNINLVAEHGAALKPKNTIVWHTLENSTTDWDELILPILERYTKLTPGSRTEIKQHSLVWHYRASSPYYAQKYAVVIKRSLKPILKKSGLELVQGSKVLEIRNPGINKGSAAQQWLEEGYSFVFAVGDDTTDESLFSVLSEGAYTVKVGRGRTAAKYRLSSTVDVINILKKLK